MLGDLELVLGQQPAPVVPEDLRVGEVDVPLQPVGPARGA